MKLNSMQCLIVGIDHRKTDIAQRERLLPNAAAIELIYAELQQHGVDECFVLSTCNRIEWYIVAKTLATEVCLQRILDTWLRFVVAEKIADHYCYTGDEAIRHLIIVACGLESMALGEPQIFGQMKAAYDHAKQLDYCGDFFATVIPFVFHIVKRIRHNTAIGQSPMSVAHIAVSLAKNIFSRFDNKRVLLIGAGDTIVLVAQYLSDLGCPPPWICNRSSVRGTRLAQKTGGSTYPLYEIPELLHQADIIVSATSSTLPLVGKGQVEQAGKQRKYATQLYFDLAVPRDIEYEVAAIDHVFLYCVDDLGAIIEGNSKLRKQAAQHAHLIINTAMYELQQRINQTNHNALLRPFRAHIQSVRDVEIRKAYTMLNRGDDPKYVIERMASALIQKIAHHPTVAMREAGKKGDTQLLQAAHTLFAIHPPATSVNSKQQTPTP